MDLKILTDSDKLWALVRLLATGILPTVRIFVFTLLIAIPLGILLAAGKRSLNRYTKFEPISLYIYFIRSTPLMLQLLFTYFLISRCDWSGSRFWMFILGDKRTQFATRCIVYVFGLNYAAYFAEIFRGGMQAVPEGQKEAAKVLGYSKIQSFFRIQLPQIFKNVMPSLTNEFVTLVKDTSIAKVIAVARDQQQILVLAEKQVSSQASVEPYLLVLVFFLLFNGVVEQICKFIERRMSYYR